MEETNKMHPRSRPCHRGNNRNDAAGVNKSSVSSISKDEALEICNRCKLPVQQGKYGEMYPEGCTLSDIKDSKSEYILNPPRCLLEQLQSESKIVRKTKQATLKVTENLHQSNSAQNGAQTAIKTPEIESGEMVRKQMDNLCTIKSPTTKKAPKILGEWDELDIKILYQIRDGYNQKEISRNLKIPVNSLKRKFDKMKAASVIDWEYKPLEPGSRVKEKTFLLKAKGAQILRYDEGGRQVRLFDGMHRVAFISDLTRGTLPRSDKPIHMKNWNGYAFEQEDCNFQTHEGKIPRVVIFMDVDLGSGDNIMSIAVKYVQLAWIRQMEFNRKYGINTGLLSWYQDPHCTVEDNLLAKLIRAVFGEVLTNSGIMVNASQSNEEVEMKGLGAAVGLEALLNDAPRMMQRLESSVTKLIETTNVSDVQRKQELDAVCNIFTQGFINISAAIESQTEMSKKQSEKLDILISLQTKLTELFMNLSVAMTQAQGISQPLQQQEQTITNKDREFDPSYR